MTTKRLVAIVLLVIVVAAVIVKYLGGVGLVVAIVLAIVAFLVLLPRDITGLKKPWEDE
jgi:hypothetical protein